ncbi:MAG: gliding motility lipoprotein GldH [Cytophagaceae bacterium]
MTIHNLEKKTKEIFSISFVISTLFLFVLLSGCDPARVYETNREVSNDAWAINDTLRFDFEINKPDKKYNIFYNIRYTEDYNFYNIYISHTLRDSSGVPIATVNQPQNMDLFASTTGAPLGSGFSNSYDYRIKVLQDFTFPYAGMYSISLKQFMREDPLQGIRAVGIRIEEAE